MKLSLIPLVLSVLGPLATAQGDHCSEVRLPFQNATSAAGLGAAVDEHQGVFVAGAPQAGQERGAAFAFERIGGAWQETPLAPLIPGGITGRWEVGASVAVHGNYAAVGAPRKDKGRVFLFERTGPGQWVYDGEVTPGSLDGVGRFGLSVALHGEDLLVGMPRARVNGNQNQGRALLFSRSSGAWASNGELVVVCTCLDNGDSLGASVHLDDEVAVVGADARQGAQDPGRLYVFRRPASGWGTVTGQEAVLEVAGLNHNIQFGFSVTRSGDTIAAGAPDDDAGAVYVFRRPGATWVDTDAPDQVIRPTQDFQANAGTSIDMRDGVLLIGANKADENVANTGAAYRYELDGQSGTWQWAETLVSRTIDGLDELGSAVAIASDGYFVGAHQDDDLSGALNSGGLYLFENSCGFPVFCFGDGTESVACPCGGVAQEGEGCPTSTGRGMRISATGALSLSNDTLRLRALDTPHGNSGAFYVGTETAPVSRLLNGLTCIGGSMHRFPGTFSPGTSDTFEGVVADAPGFFVPGSTYYFQYCSRDVGAGPGCPQQATLSPVIAVLATM